ncbi:MULTISPECIES: hypothetical protein [unclassified Beijerinckia]|uniref:hypothetical protein n=1 Tax=unclassified Beijerinckia TaxID=2638183 RepID=UPI00089476F4|nr:MULTISPECIES: hypothetical protein [unclassified Beijerinckia]MDH7799710.1 hypothetical protein [Beijerinckia sp. GAS462]SED34413.1 hypothetical protein SAMN05443249_5128 [Beijerinckia sp. 28-YEA-48]
MKLASANVDQAMSHLDAQVVPDDHPVNERLVSLFGDHTFFLNQSGLNIVEPAEPVEPGDDGALTGRVIKLATWTDESRTSLAPHEREVTEVVVPLSDVA